MSDRASKHPGAGLRATVANIGWLSMDRALRMGGGLVIGSLVARYLAPASFGRLNLAIAIYMLFNTASNLGLDYLVVRDVVLHPERNHEVLGTAFWLKAAASVVTTACAAVFTHFTHPGDPSLVFMVLLLSAAAISQALDVIDYFFQAHTLSKLTVVPRLFTYVLINIGRVAAVLFHGGVLVFAELAAAETLLGELALLLPYWRHPHGLPRWTAQLARARSLLRESWPMVIASLLVMVYMRTDQILLGYMLGDRAVGYYSAAVRLSEIWYAIPALICNSVMPRLLPLLASDRALYYRRIQTLYNAMVFVSVLLGLATLPVSHPLVRLLFGSSYLPAAPVLNLHIWTGVFVFIGVTGGQQLVHERLTVIELQRAALGAVVNLALNLLLIPRMGILGSALATLLAQATASYLADACSPRTRHLFRLKTYALSGVWLLRGEWPWLPAARQATPEDAQRATP